MDQNDNLEHQTIHQIHVSMAEIVVDGQGALQDYIRFNKINIKYVDIQYYVN